MIWVLSALAGGGRPIEQSMALLLFDEPLAPEAQRAVARAAHSIGGVVAVRSSGRALCVDFSRRPRSGRLRKAVGRAGLSPVVQRTEDCLTNLQDVGSAPTTYIEVRLVLPLEHSDAWSRMSPLFGTHIVEATTQGPSVDRLCLGIPFSADDVRVQDFSSGFDVAGTTEVASCP